MPQTVQLNHVSAKCSEGFCAFGLGISSGTSHLKLLSCVGEKGLHHTIALCTGCTKNGDLLGRCHCDEELVHSKVWLVLVGCRPCLSPDRSVQSRIYTSSKQKNSTGYRAALESITNNQECLITNLHKAGSKSRLE